METDLLKPWNEFKEGKDPDQQPNGQFDGFYLETMPEESVAGDRWNISKTGQKPRPQCRRQDGRDGKPDSGFGIGISTHKKGLEDVIGQMNDGRRPNRNLNWKEERKRWKEKRTEAKPRKKGQRRYE